MLSRWIYDKNNGEADFSHNGNKTADIDFQIDVMKNRIKELELENEILKKQRM